MVTAAKACPTCGVSVAGCTETVGENGGRKWVQPTYVAYHGTSHRPSTMGGLSHTEGGRRCLSDSGDLW